MSQSEKEYNINNWVKIAKNLAKLSQILMQFFCKSIPSGLKREKYTKPPNVRRRGGFAIFLRYIKLFLATLQKLLNIC